MKLRHYETDHVATRSQYLILVVSAYNSQVHGSTGPVPFAFVSSRRHTPVAIERLTAGTETGDIVTPGRAKENFFSAPRLPDLPIKWYNCKRLRPSTNGPSTSAFRLSAKPS